MHAALSISIYNSNYFTFLNLISGVDWYFLFLLFIFFLFKILVLIGLCIISILSRPNSLSYPVKAEAYSPYNPSTRKHNFEH